jgi:hypothetical protein
MLSEDLKRSNTIAFVAHVVSAIVIIVLYSEWPATRTRSSFDAFRSTIAGPEDTECTTGTNGTPSQCNVTVGLTKPKPMISVNLIFGTIAFFVITAIAHAFYATDGFGSGSYSKAIADGWNPYRWFEYATTASIMTALISLADGIRDVQTVLLLVFITAAMQFCGYSVESQLRGHQKIGTNAKDSITGISVVGWLLFVALWSTIIATFAFVVSDINTKYADEVDPDTGDKIAVPSWIWFVVIFQLIYYALFGFVQYNHIKSRLSGLPFNYSTTEKAYIGLSFSAKLSLAAGLGYGLLWRTKDCPVP